MTQPHPYGVAAQFEDADQLLAAAKAARDAGYRRMEAYSPYPLKELDEYIPVTNLVPPMAFAAGVAGGFIGYYMQYFLNGWVYQTNIGGRPVNSWPSYTVITFAMAVLFALITVFFGTLYFNGFPTLYHPLFRIPAFKRVTDDAFFFCIEARDGKFHPTHTAHFLRSLDPVKVWEVDYE